MQDRTKRGAQGSQGSQASQGARAGKVSAPEEWNTRLAASAGKPTRARGGASAEAVAWDALRSVLRLQLLEAIATKPGTTARELADALGTSPPRLHYHLNLLTRAGLVRTMEPATDGQGGAAGFEVATPNLLRDAESRLGEDPGRLADLLADLLEDLVGEDVGLAAKAWKGGGGANWARTGHEALAAHELEAVRGHLQAIEAIFDRARTRRLRSASLVQATARLSFALSVPLEPGFPTGLLGWSERPDPGRSGGSAASKRRPRREAT